MEHTNFILYCNQSDMIKKLSNEQAGILLKKIHEYCANGRSFPDFKGDVVLDIVFTAHKTILDKDHQKFLDRCEKNKINVQKRWDAYKQNQK